MLQRPASQQLPSVALMKAKSLKMRGPRHRAETRSRCVAPDGGTAKRHRRSVHREVSRPQGSRSPLRQFSPVSRRDADGHGVNVPEASIAGLDLARRHADLSGFEVVAWIQRSALELGMSLSSRESGYVKPTNGRPTDG